MKKQIVKSKGKFAVVHNDGILVRGINRSYVNFASDFSRAMTFSSLDDAKDMARFINEKVSESLGKKFLFIALFQIKTIKSLII
ncbi:MAG: hypothetical protein LBP26_06260 [Clostridiales bacterium]|jgi:hypothetical protein|nr:hypothetical protein [Clostridiales bacterium]